MAEPRLKSRSLNLHLRVLPTVPHDLSCTPQAYNPSVHRSGPDRSLALPCLCSLLLLTDGEEGESRVWCQRTEAPALKKSLKGKRLADLRALRSPVKAVLARKQDKVWDYKQGGCSHPCEAKTDT